MKTSNSKASILIKKLALLPLLTGLVFLFADRVEAQTKKKKPRVIEIKTETTEATKAQIDEYRTFVKKVEESSIIKQKELVKMFAIYNSMSKAQKKTEKNIHDLVPPIPIIRKKTVSKTLFNKMKNGEKYAVWIDGKTIDNKELNKYSHTDFVSYTGSFVHKNARSKRFPQQYQYTLYTQPYFEKIRERMKERYGENLPPPPPPKPIKIDVVKKGKKTKLKELPPPPPPRKKKVKKIKEVKPPKKYKVTVIELKDRPEVIELLETPEQEEEREVEELIELKELPEISELEEEERELEEVQELISIKEISNLFETEVNGKTKVNYYYKGKKISRKKARKILARHQEKKSNELKMKTVRDKEGNKYIYLTD